MNELDYNNPDEHDRVRNNYMSFELKRYYDERDSYYDEFVVEEYDDTGSYSGRSVLPLQVL